MSVHEHVEHAHSPRYSDKCDHITKITKNLCYGVETNVSLPLKHLNPSLLKIWQPLYI